MADYTVKQHDHGTTLVIDLQKQNPDTKQYNPIDLTGVTEVKLLMKAEGIGLVTGIAAVTDAVAGEITYTWDADDLNADATYEAEVQLTWTGGAVETVPNDSYFSILVKADLNAGD